MEIRVSEPLKLVPYEDTKIECLDLLGVDPDKIGQMFKVMTEKNGCGLAAPQVGWAYNVFVVEVEGVRKVFINPSVKFLTEKKYTVIEGCLTLPGETYIVERAATVQVDRTDENGQIHKGEIYKGFLAQVIQHEWDHLRMKCICDIGQRVEAACK